MPTYHPLVTKRRTKKMNRRSINQKELANRLGIDQAKMGRYERGEQIPSYDDAKAIGDYFELPWHKIIELCVEFRDRQQEFAKFFSTKLSESSSDSTVCTTSPSFQQPAVLSKKCGAR